MGIESKILNATRAIGIDLGRFSISMLHAPRFIRDWRRYNRLQRLQGGMSIHLANIKPLLCDYVDQAGRLGDYFHQDLWAAIRVHEARPVRHVDIGSRIDGFIAHLLVFTKVEVIDIRPLTNSVPNLSFIQADATDLRNIADNSIESLSSLHAIEHFGLGRYSDAIDPQACYKAMRAMARVLAPGGRLYFGGPIGKERVEFNSQRVFAPSTLHKIFTEAGLSLVEFSACRAGGPVVLNANMNDYTNDISALGLWIFSK